MREARPASLQAQALHTTGQRSAHGQRCSSLRRTASVEQIHLLVRNYLMQFELFILARVILDPVNDVRM